jgi:RNase H-fold protein (predicted Holliday junction resolvase)
VRVLAVDPGREKCGLAVCDPEGILAHRIIPTPDVDRLVRTWTAAYRVDAVIVGNRTYGKHVFDMIGELPVPVSMAEEAGTTLGARRRYFQDHPPRGWRKLLPLDLQTPPEPYDDYAAVLIGERYLSGEAGEPAPMSKNADGKGGADPSQPKGR